MSAPRALGDYDLGALIGRGGTSEVYEARHRVRGDIVAIKVLRSHLAGDDAAIAAFVAEATRTRTVVHPNVVRVRDFGHDTGSGAFYLVMERLVGDTLAAVIARGPLGEARARELGAAIADGVAAAHARGVVHRDLKPGNIVLVAGGVPTLVDFGIARIVAGLGAGGEAVVTTTRIGTPAYMAPEQLAGGVIAPTIDVWALGTVLFEMVTGRVPFDTAGGASPQLVASAPRLGAPVSAAYAAIVARCLEREPALRPRAIADVARELRGQGGDPARDRLTEDLGAMPAAMTLPTAVAAPAAKRRRARWLAPVAAIAIAGAAVLAWQLVAGSASPVAVDTPPPAAAPPAAAAVTAPAESPPAAAAPSSTPAAPPPRPHGTASSHPTRTGHPTGRGSATAPRAGETLD
jgi:serine/threonine-protein kinase|nr:serine/threonine-protein kinase [Kofleriaceae bacterium]